MTGETQRRGGERHTASKLTWALLAVGLCPVAVDAAVLSWINPGVNEPWENPANWAPAFVPGVGDIAMVGNLPRPPPAPPAWQGVLRGGARVVRNRGQGLRECLGRNCTVFGFYAGKVPGLHMD